MGLGLEKTGLGKGTIWTPPRVGGTDRLGVMPPLLAFLLCGPQCSTLLSTAIPSPTVGTTMGRAHVALFLFSVLATALRYGPCSHISSPPRGFRCCRGYMTILTLPAAM